MSFALRLPLFFYLYASHRYLHSFPTRRSSDLAAGVAIWLDDVNRTRLTTGNLAALARDRHVVGVTSNPTIFAHALSQGDRSEEHTSELQSHSDIVCRLLLEKKKRKCERVYTAL